jgi:hypothetical protein
MTGVDGGGVYGSILYYSLTIAYVGSAFLIFVYLYKKGKLDMDETPKNHMMETDENED